MKTQQELTKDIKIDLVKLGLNADKLESLTTQEARKANHKAAKETHPDKADPANPDQFAGC